MQRRRPSADTISLAAAVKGVTAAQDIMMKAFWREVQAVADLYDICAYLTPGEATWLTMKIDSPRWMGPFDRAVEKGGELSNAHYALNDLVNKVGKRNAPLVARDHGATVYSENSMTWIRANGRRPTASPNSMTGSRNIIWMPALDESSFVVENGLVTAFKENPFALSDIFDRSVARPDIQNLIGTMIAEAKLATIEPLIMQYNETSKSEKYSSRG